MHHHYRCPSPCRWLCRCRICICIGICVSASVRYTVLEQTNGRSLRSSYFWFRFRFCCRTNFCSFMALHSIKNVSCVLLLLLPRTPPFSSAFHPALPLPFGFSPVFVVAFVAGSAHLHLLCCRCRLLTFFGFADDTVCSVSVRGSGINCKKMGRKFHIMAMRCWKYLLIFFVGFF